VKVRAELADAAVEAELRLTRLVRLGAAGGFLADDDAEAGHQVGGLPCALGYVVEAEAGVAQEDLPVRPEPDPGPGGLPRPAGAR